MELHLLKSIQVLAVALLHRLRSTHLAAPADGRYVRITVNGNTQNDWASITEILSFGDAAGGGSPVPTDPGPMYHRWQNTTSTTTGWSAYQSLGGNIKSNPAVIANQDARLEVFAVVC